MKYNLPNVLHIFSSASYADARRELLEQMQRELNARETPIRQLIDAIYYRSMNQPGTTPTLVIEFGVWYGMALGVFMERYREKGRKFDVTNITAMFLNDASEERRKVMDDLRIEIQAHDPEMLKLLYTIAQECEETRGCDREKTVEIAMCWGMCLGILAEQDRQLLAREQVV